MLTLPPEVLLNKKTVKVSLHRTITFILPFLLSVPVVYLFCGTFVWDVFIYSLVSWIILSINLIVQIWMCKLLHVLSSRRRSRSASSSGSSSSGSPSPKKAVKRVSSTPPRKQGHHLDASVSPSGKDRRSPSPRGKKDRGSASPPRSSGTEFVIGELSY